MKKITNINRILQRQNSDKIYDYRYTPDELVDIMKPKGNRIPRPEHLRRVILELSNNKNITAASRNYRIENLIISEVVNKVTYSHNYFWIGDFKGFWAAEYNNKLYRDVVISLDTIIEEYLDVLEYRSNTKTIFEIKEKIKKKTYLSNQEIDSFDSLDYINFSNGHWDIVNWEWAKLDEPLYEFIQNPNEYKEDLKDPEIFLTMLKKAARNQETTEDCQNWINDMQEIFGYCLTKRVNLKTMFWFVDAVKSELGKPKGNNLKSTVQKCLNVCVGKGNYVKQTVQYTTSGKFAKEGLVTAQIVYCSDNSEKEITDTGELKDMVDTDEFTYEAKHGKVTITIPNTKKYIYGFQRIPWIKNAVLDDALTGRIKFMFFKYSVDKKDRDSNWFEREIRYNQDEIEKIICWAMKGLKRLLERGYFLRQDADENMNLWKNEVDPLYKFMNSCVVTNKKFPKCNLTDLKAFYDEWLLWNHKEQNLSTIKFKKRILDLNFKPYRTGGYIKFYGLDLDFSKDNIREIWDASDCRDLHLTKSELDHYAQLNREIIN